MILPAGPSVTFAQGMAEGVEAGLNGASSLGDIVVEERELLP